MMKIHRFRSWTRVVTLLKNLSSLWRVNLIPDTEFLSQFEDLHIPALPPLNINGDDQYSVSLALSDLNIRGISDIDVTEFTHTSEGFQANRQDFQTFRMKFNKLYLDVGTYNAAGHLLNLPFNGEGPMSLGFINLDITIDFTWDPFKPLYSRQKKGWYTC
ncbi:hypothetical protein Pmani_011216 [Petrolisthes manimaculis]|uniref:Uncharacterized protein n=1 Tax=Petrolisthes manimaculis TaxID=1843537 RepID=A0AAE1Q1N6_9EUCA|nr:hypothetical protein Pmani_011216 [Petrolisthes manimaculis]